MPILKSNAMRRTTATTLTVAVKCRSLTWKDRGHDIVRVIGGKEVLVLDPDLSKDYLDRVQHRTKEKKYGFDHAFGPKCLNSDLYDQCISSTIAGVVQGLNATIFAYGSTGSGKTYTMVGTQEDPGLMVLSLHTIFDLIKKNSSSDDFDVSCSYLEVYNEVIYDLLEKSSGHLELREDPVRGIVVAGLRSIKVHSADRILELLNLGNSRRKTESTEANNTSSRSHAVLEIIVKRKQKNKYRNQVMQGKLALVDLAGSERASETNSCGKKLRDGANINRSLLALANCINALGKHHKKGVAYVPYRNSKLTRILKDGLSGNSQTVMVATVSPAECQYHHSVNTLKYADRAKEIKTHIQKNIGTISTHLSDYQRMIDCLQEEVVHLKKELAEKESQRSDRPTGKAAHEELSWLNLVSQETSEIVQQRINLQKAIFELEKANICNRTELHHLDVAIAKPQAIGKDGIVVETLRTRRQLILDNIRDNDEAGIIYEKEIAANERHRSELQLKINQAFSNPGDKTYLRVLSQYWLLVDASPFVALWLSEICYESPILPTQKFGMANTELQFEIAKRDEVIQTQREVRRNLWNLLMELGLDKRLLDVASLQGTPIEEYMISYSCQSPYYAQYRYPPPGHLPVGNYVTYPSNSQGHRYFCSEHLWRGNSTPVYRTGHYSPYYSPSPNELSPSTHSIARSPNQVSGSSSPSCSKDPTAPIPSTSETHQSFNFSPAT